MRSPIAILSLAGLLSGCNAGPDFAPPNPGLPQTSFTIDGSERAVATRLPQPADPAWWRALNDPQLTRLIERASQANLDVLSATLRIAESRDERRVTASAQFPQINADGRYQRELYSRNGIASLIGALTTGRQPGSTTVPITPINDFTIGFDASWELDLWGKVRRQVEAAEAQVDQMEERRRDALVSVFAEIARNYIELRGAQTQIAVLKQNLRLAESSASIARERQRNGLGTGIDVQNAEAQVEAARAQLPTFEAQEAQYINAIGFLLDQPPQALRAELAAFKPIPVNPPRIPIGIASELALRRPDIRAAEAQLHAATADIGVAVASFYPSVKLNGTVSLDSLTVTKLFRASSLQYIAGPSVSLPLFDGGRLKGNLELRKAQQQEAAVAYHKTVLQAWHEVVNALTNYRLEQARRARLKEQVDHARQAAALSLSRYKNGVSPYLNVLDAQRVELQAMQAYATSTTSVSLNLVQLFKALGGGWEEVFPDTPAPKDDVTQWISPLVP